MTEGTAYVLAGILAFAAGCLALVAFAATVTLTRFGCWILGEHDHGVQVWSLGKPSRYVIRCRRCRKPLPTPTPREHNPAGGTT